MDGDGTGGRGYSLRLSASQAEAISEASELYARIGTAQFGDLLEHPDVRRLAERLLPGQREELRAAVATCERILRGPQGARSARDSTPGARACWDVHQVLRHRLAWDEAGNPPTRRPDMFQVMFDEPYRTADEPLPSISMEPAASSPAFARTQR